MSILKRPRPRRIRRGGWCAGWPLRTGTPRSFWGCCARVCGRSAEIQSDIHGTLLLIHIHRGFGLAQVIEEAPFFDLAEKVIRILRVERLDRKSTRLNS